MSVKAKTDSLAGPEKPDAARTAIAAIKTHLRRVLDSLRSRLAKKLSLAAVAIGGFVAVGHFLVG